jgi:hypothetical protein
VGSGEWSVTIPAGYFDCSANAARYIKWNVNGILYLAERYIKRFRCPDLAQGVARGEDYGGGDDGGGHSAEGIVCGVEEWRDP